MGQGAKGFSQNLLKKCRWSTVGVVLLTVEYTMHKKDNQFHRFKIKYLTTFVFFKTFVPLVLTADQSHFPFILFLSCQHLVMC